MFLVVYKKLTIRFNYFFVVAY